MGRQPRPRRGTRVSVGSQHHCIQPFPAKANGSHPPCFRGSLVGTARSWPARRQRRASILRLRLTADPFPSFDDGQWVPAPPLGTGPPLHSGRSAAPARASTIPVGACARGFATLLLSLPSLKSASAALGLRSRHSHGSPMTRLLFGSGCPRDL